jgi:hypothetical protein
MARYPLNMALCLAALMPAPPAAAQEQPSLIDVTAADPLAIMTQYLGGCVKKLSPLAAALSPPSIYETRRWRSL